MKKGVQGKLVATRLTSEQVYSIIKNSSPSMFDWSQEIEIKLIDSCTNYNQGHQFSFYQGKLCN